MHVSRVRHEQRGGVLVVSALMIPVFLLLTALVVDVGNWFTHDRQLQNRADAAAFAAGVEYANNWKACIQTGNVVLKQSTAGAIADAARQYAGDPEASDYSTGTLPSLRNTEIANQANLDVVINSSDPNYTDDTDNTDGGVGVVADPCYSHTPGTDSISPGGGQWTDVQGQGAQPPVHLRRESGCRSRAPAPGRASRSGRRSAGTDSCRSRCRTT